MISGKPYYEIKYKEVGEDYYHIGYVSYKLENVLAWKDECFDIVKECRPQTNADRIRSMNDEELAFVVMCPADITGGDTECDQHRTCYEHTLDWLRRGGVV